MKPFNLEEFKAGKPAVTRSGYPARYLGTLEGSGNIVVAVKCDGDESSLTYFSTGNYFYNCEHHNDLFMTPEKKEGWLVVKDSLIRANIFISREQAERIASSRQENNGDPYPDGYYKVVHITWEE